MLDEEGLYHYPILLIRRDFCFFFFPSFSVCREFPEFFSQVVRGSLVGSLVLVLLP